MNRYITMKPLNEYLLSKTRRPKSYDMKNPHEFGCLVEAYHDVYDLLYNKFSDAVIPSPYEPELFFLTKEDVKETIKKDDEVIIYEIPKEYDTLKKFTEFEQAYVDGEIILENLKQIKFEEL